MWFGHPRRARERVAGKIFTVFQGHLLKYHKPNTIVVTVQKLKTTKYKNGIHPQELFSNELILNRLFQLRYCTVQQWNDITPQVKFFVKKL